MQIMINQINIEANVRNVIVLDINDIGEINGTNINLTSVERVLKGVNYYLICQRITSLRSIIFKKESVIIPALK